MVSRGAAATLMLALVTTARPASAGVCPQPGARGKALPPAAAAWVDVASARAGQGACQAAGDALTAAYDILGGHPRHLGALHSVFADAVDQYVATHREADHPEPAPLCAADSLALRHLARVRALGRSTPAFEATIDRLRSGLHARLRARGGWCPDHPPPAGLAEATAADLSLAPGQLIAETRVPRPIGGERSWVAAKRAGVALMGIGLMTLGGGIAAGALERAPAREALQAGLLVGGVSLFVAGFPLVVVADQKVRAAVALGPGGVRLAF